MGKSKSDNANNWYGNRTVKTTAYYSGHLQNTVSSPLEVTHNLWPSNSTLRYSDKLCVHTPGDMYQDSHSICVR
jgi:hypothetical protein